MASAGRTYPPRAATRPRSAALRTTGSACTGRRAAARRCCWSRNPVARHRAAVGAGPHHLGRAAKAGRRGRNPHNRLQGAGSGRVAQQLRWPGLSAARSLPPWGVCASTMIDLPSGVISELCHKVSRGAVPCSTPGAARRVTGRLSASALSPGASTLEQPELRQPGHSGQLDESELAPVGGPGDRVHVIGDHALTDDAVVLTAAVRPAVTGASGQVVDDDAIRRRGAIAKR